MPKKAKPVRVTDAQLIASLERKVLENGPLLLWNGIGEFPAHKALGLSFGKHRTLKQALESFYEPPPILPVKKGRGK